MTRFIRFLGACLVFTGLGAADSANILIPIGMITVGALILGGLEAEHDD